MQITTSILQAAKLPPMLLVHGTEDETVPFTNSLCFHDVSALLLSPLLDRFQNPSIDFAVLVRFTGHNTIDARVC